MNTLQELDAFLEDFKKIYDTEKAKLPYHINLIDELHANENAHSRILEKLLQQKTSNNKFEILENFIGYLKNKSQNFSAITIQNPIITQEQQRIDLWIRDNKSYAIVIENKIHNATDQHDGKIVKGGQLERYIDTTKSYGFKNEQKIYVLYLPPTNEKEPDEKTWGKYSNSDIHKNRYLKLSFKDDILPWLQNSVLPNIRLEDKYLSSAIEQYIDHLEGKFSLRTISNKLNMKLQEMIKDKLKLNKSHKENFSTLAETSEMLKNALNQIELLIKEEERSCFEEWAKKLQEEYKYLPVSDAGYIGVILGEKEKTLKLSIFPNNDTLVYGIIPFDMYNEEDEEDEEWEDKYEELSAWLKPITDELQLSVDKQGTAAGWFFARANTTFENAYSDLTTLISKVEELLKKDSNQ
ncbi:MAG: PD-(D/E)XK nuclease family protein [Candidatus Symbiothrix sp.]|jgi:hypothetical protein|nr:PD-(D/E)XK nuclease family protein [Candidatus Symbiothrix sp.]